MDVPKSEMILSSRSWQGLPRGPGARGPACLLQTFPLGSSKPINILPFLFGDDLKQCSELQVAWMVGDKTWEWRGRFLSGSGPQTTLGAAAPSTPVLAEWQRWHGHTNLILLGAQWEEERTCLPSQKLSLT